MVLGVETTVGSEGQSASPLNLDEASVDLCTPYAEDRVLKVDVLLPRKLGIEARADLKERGATRPTVRAWPSVGSVMHGGIWRRAVLPLSLRPMMPGASP